MSNLRGVDNSEIDNSLELPNFIYDAFQLYQFRFKHTKGRFLII